VRVCHIGCVSLEQTGFYQDYADPSSKGYQNEIKKDKGYTDWGGSDAEKNGDWARER